MAQLEHQAVRIENLELMSQFGTNAWKVYNEYVAAGPHVTMHFKNNHYNVLTFLPFFLLQ